MVCSKCGKQMEADARFCSRCGAVHEGAGAPPPPFAGAFRASRPLVRSRARRMLGGVCAGLADAYGWDLNLVRLVAVVVTLFTGVPVLAYLAAWIIIPEGQYALPFGAPPATPPPASAAGTTTF